MPDNVVATPPPETKGAAGDIAKDASPVTKEAPAAVAPTPPPVIGKTSATERDANSSDKFNFWLTPVQIVNPFDIVQVEHMGEALVDGKPTGKPSRSYGLVTTIEHKTDSPNHLANFVSSNFGDVNENNINTPRIGTNVAKVNILSNNGEVYMPVQNDRPVTFATPDGIQEALGIDTMSERNRIPAGLIKMSNGAATVAYIDQEFILGPEGAHINMSGISGLATKTSFATFMLQSILQKAEKSKDENGVALSDRIAVIILNVKQGDLLQIDQRPENNPSVEQMEMWEAMGMEPRPFKNVRYLLPRSNQPGMPNSFLEPVSGYQMFAYALQDAADKLDLLLSDISDQSGAMDALVGDIMQGLVNREPAFKNCNSWDNLLNGEPLVKNGKSEKWSDHYVSTIGKFRRHLRRIIRTRSTGLFTNARARNELNINEQIREIEGGQTYVVDIARLNDEEQKLVFGDVLRTVYELKAEDPENRTSKKPIPEKIIFFVDELNKYAPAGVRGSPILEQVLDIAERGRSLGVVLFSAQQFMSAVHARVTGNCATKILGRTGSSEISAPDYRFLDDDLKMNLTRLGKGELIVTHAVYRQPVKIIFPRPAYKQRQPGT